MDWKPVSEFELKGSSWLAPKVCEMQVIGYSRKKYYYYVRMLETGYSDTAQL